MYLSFLKQLLCIQPNKSHTAEYHAMGGPIGVTQANFAPLLPEFLRATEWAQLPRADLNAPLIYGMMN